MSEEDELVPVEALTEPRQRFRCDVLRSTLSAAACGARALAEVKGGRNQHRAPVLWAQHPVCALCKVGEDVRRRVGIPGTPPPAQAGQSPDAGAPRPRRVTGSGAAKGPREGKGGQ